MSAGRALRAPATRGPGERRSACGHAAGPTHSRLFVLGDALGWALDDEAAYVSAVARRAGYRLGQPAWARFARDQAVFHTSHFAGLDPLWTGSSHRLGLAYFHGRPGTPGFPEFDRAYEALRARAGPLRPRAGDAPRDGGHRRRRRRGARARPPDPDRHRARPLPARRPRERRCRAGRARAPGRRRSSSGSFQKDGVGFGDGLEPKAIKGPDVLVEALDGARREIPEPRRPAHRAGARVRAA